MVKTPRCNCPHTEFLFTLLGKKWVMFILEAIDTGCHTFTEIRHHIGEANTKILTDRLTELGEYQIIEKHSDGYFLTPKGKELITQLLNTAHWWGETLT